MNRIARYLDDLAQVDDLPAFDGSKFDLATNGQKGSGLIKDKRE